MHQSSMNEMACVIHTHLGAMWSRGLRVLDVGSQAVNRAFPHTYRDLMSPAWEYVGCDVEPGPNVDLIMDSPYRIQDKGECFDVVISGQCLEHVPRPWKLVPEMARMLKPGGMLILSAPWTWEVHRFPLDCWRILPDGMSVLLADAGLREITTYIREKDCWGIGRKIRLQPAACSLQRRD